MGSRRFLSLDARSGLAESEVASIAELPGGRFVLGHNEGLTFIDRGGERIEKAFEIRELSERFRGGVPRLLDSAGTVWAAASIALLEIGRDRRVAIHRFPDRAVSVLVDGRGRLFVLGAQGVYVRRGGRFYELPLGFAENPPPDKSGRWLATDGGDRLFVASRAGLLWRGGMNAPEVDPRAVWHRAVSADKRGDNVYAVFTTPAGEVLVGTAGGLYRLIGGALEAATGALALERPVYFLLRDRSGRLWAGTDDGVFVAEAGGFRQLSIRHGLAGRETNRGAGLVDSAGRVWIGTDQGLSIYREALDVRLSAPPAVAGDGTRLLEVFENLLGNAVKFMGDQAAPRIEVGLREGPEPVIVVSDNGIGIDPRFKDKVFDLFERLDRKVAGTGIGLAIVKRIVEFHGGRIWVESTGVPGEGSRFCLTLPAAAPATPEPPAPGSTA